MKQREDLSPRQVWREYEQGVAFNDQIQLGDTVRVNEDFFIGKQWEGVNANGLPTPVFNFIKRIVLFLVSSTATDNVTMVASPLSSVSAAPGVDIQTICDAVNAQFRSLFEENRIAALVREFTRDAAVRGDACLYSWFDPEEPTGQRAQGAIKTQLLENTRVFFGNPNGRDVQSQPYILISRRESVEDVQREAERGGGDWESVKTESDQLGDRFDRLTDGKVTTLTRFWRRDGDVWWMKTVRDGVILPARNSCMRRYPIVWMSWDHVTNCYHGQAIVTGLIPNQVFVNKAFAMTMISLMTTAFPKIIYNKQLIPQWDSGVGKAIPVNPTGDLAGAAKAIDPASTSPQVSQFIELAVNMTKEFMGATDAALGNVKPDNTSAIIALQKSSSVPLELVKQNLYQAVEDLGRIWLDQMRAYYGARFVEINAASPQTRAAHRVLWSGQKEEKQTVLFDFAGLEQVPLSLKLDVGGSAYWSEIAQISTLENLLVQGKITTVDFLERLPNGYISHQEELIQTLKEREQMGNPLS